MLKEVEGLKSKKDVLRARALEIGRNFCQNFPESHLTLIKRKVFLFLQEILPSHWTPCAAYRSLDFELPFEEIVGLFPRITWAYPKVEGIDLGFYVPDSKKDFLKNSWGLSEPHVPFSKKVFLSQLKAIIVPALAYDRKLNRLGRGKGYYDRVLKDFKGLKIGVCYSAQVFNEEFPLEKKMDGSQDIQMDFVITEKFFFHNWSKNLKEKLKSN